MTTAFPVSGGGLHSERPVTCSTLPPVEPSMVPRVGADLLASEQVVCCCLSPVGCFRWRRWGPWGRLWPWLEGADGEGAAQLVVQCCGQLAGDGQHCSWDQPLGIAMLTIIAELWCCGHREGALEDGRAAATRSSSEEPMVGTTRGEGDTGAPFSSSTSLGSVRACEGWHRISGPRHLPPPGHVPTASRLVPICRPHLLRGHLLHHCPSSAIAPTPSAPFLLFSPPAHQVGHRPTPPPLLRSPPIHVHALRGPRSPPPGPPLPCNSGRGSAQFLIEFQLFI